MANTKPLASQVKYGSGNNTVDKTLKKSILSFPTLVEAQAAAATLPDGQAIDVDSEQKRYRVESGALVFDRYLEQLRQDIAEDNGSSLVGYDGGTVQDVLDTVKPIADYPALRAYTGLATGVLITNAGIYGSFIIAPESTAEDDGGLVIVGTDGRRWVRAGYAVMASVSPEIFGAVGDGVTDDSDPIQKALNTKRTVVLSQKYRITRPMVVNGQRVEGRGVTINSGTWAMTTINVGGNFSAFKAKSDNGPVCADVSGLFIWYGDTTPTDSATNDQKRGFDFRNPDFPADITTSTQLTKISNCLVKGGWYAVDYSGGSYLTKMERVWSWSCRMGFRYLGGTTLYMDTCYALFGEQAYFIQGVANVTMQNCAMDQMVVTETTPQRAAAVFANIPGLNINGFYTELNEVKVDAGSLVMFIECVGEAKAITYWREALSCTSGQEVYGYRFYGGRMKVSGSAPQVSGQRLEFTGNGIVIGLLAQEGATVTIDTSNIPAPIGGTPTTRYANASFSGALIYSYASDLSGGVDMSLPMVAGKGVAFTPTLDAFTVTGTPIVTGTIRRSGSMAFVDIQINPNGGTVASATGVSNIPNLPFPAVGRPVASIMNGDFAGGHGYMNGSMLVMPYLAASSSPIYISAVYPVA